VARDATARQFDVEADDVKLDQSNGQITFHAKKGRLVDLDKLHESIWATRLSGGTGMGTNWLDVTAVGDVVVEKDRIILKVAGSEEYFVLKEDPKDPKAKSGDKTAFARLRESVEDGKKSWSVFGRVEGWAGHFPPFLKAPPKKPRTILVKEFDPVKK
jgi:hypothetical protein